MFQNEETRVVIKERMIIRYDALQALLKLRISEHFSHPFLFSHRHFPFPVAYSLTPLMEYFISPMVDLVFSHFLPIDSPVHPLSTHHP